MAAVVVPTEVAIWALTGGGLFRPAAVVLVLAGTLGGHAWALRRPPGRRERELRARIERLTRTRSGALDAQAQELRRIERDLHDGAQARLVRSGMTLGLAEQPAANRSRRRRELLAEARDSTRTALDDLRAVLRASTRPCSPTAACRRAVQALALDLALPVDVRVDLPGSAPPADRVRRLLRDRRGPGERRQARGAGRAGVEIAHRDGRLVAAVTDDGAGGADQAAGPACPGSPAGSRRSTASSTVTSPPGGPTRSCWRCRAGCHRRGPRPSCGTA